MTQTNERTIVSSRLISSPSEKVFQAWTDPSLLAQWWGPKGFTNTFHEFDLRPGGIWRFTMHGPNGEGYPNKSVFLEIVPNSKLVFEHLEEVHYFKAVVTFDAIKNKTKVTFSMEFETAEECDKVRMYVVPGNEENFDKLEALLEKNFSHSK